MKSQRSKLCFIITNCQRSCSDKGHNWTGTDPSSNPTRDFWKPNRKRLDSYMCVYILGLGKLHPLFTTSMLFILVNIIISELSRKRQGACIESDHLCLANRACDATLKSAPTPPPPPSLHQRRPTLLNFSSGPPPRSAATCVLLCTQHPHHPQPPLLSSPLLSSPTKNKPWLQ